MADTQKPQTIEDVLLRRSRRVFVSVGSGGASRAKVRGALLEIAELGYAATVELERRLSSVDAEALSAFVRQTCGALAALRGANYKHTPLFRKFPQGVPEDTRELWWKKVLVNFLQAEGQPCVHCGKTSTTHVLRPCRDVVCDHCWDHMLRLAATDEPAVSRVVKEFVTVVETLLVEPAFEAGARYAVMVVNKYAGMLFDQLERAFAGVMLRDDRKGRHFDPRTVELKFEVRGTSGTYLPFVLDLREGTLHWLDAYSRGELLFNNVQTSNAAIQTVCPAMMTYFTSGVRCSLYELALLHAASRCTTVILRRDRPYAFSRGSGESPSAFLGRLRQGAGDEPCDMPTADAPPVLALLHRGDPELPLGSEAYALFPERTRTTMSASDLVTAAPRGVGQ